MPKIKGLPEDGDVRNTNLFKSTAPFLTEMSINEFIYNLLLLIPVWHEKGVMNDMYNRGFDSADVNLAFTWKNTPQGHQFWSDVYHNHQRNKFRV